MLNCALEMQNSRIIVLFTNFISFTQLYFLISLIPILMGKKRVWLKHHLHFYLYFSSFFSVSSLCVCLCLSSSFLFSLFYFSFNKKRPLSTSGVVSNENFTHLKYFTRYHLSPTLGNLQFLSVNNLYCENTLCFGAHAHSLFCIQATKGKGRKESTYKWQFINVQCYYNAFDMCYHRNSFLFLQYGKKVF